ncbi:MAG TPA: DNA polymerase, partial [Alphaproteobacteria bacterium]|nr:DNA polymerase [Alphaproteobacteria bacterium]
GISPGEANQIIARYFSRFPEIRDFMEEAKEEARKQGYVLTLLGRKCMMDGINDKNGARRAAVERQAINAPLQGTAADVMKRAMIAVDRWLQESKIDARLILQVHDELVLEARDDVAQEVANKVSELMEHAGREMKISVPLTADADIAQAWE